MLTNGLSDPRALALQLQFLGTMYDNSKAPLIGSPLARTVERDYQLTLTNAVAAFHRITTNDLGNDAGAWIRKYGAN